VVDNLKISHIEVRLDDDPDVAQYTHDKQVEYIRCESGAASALAGIKKDVSELMRGAARRLSEKQIVNCSDPNKLNLFIVIDAQR
jgi:ERCC4-related helicase